MAKARLLSIFALAAALSGCIRNDIPYPVIPASITAMDVEGALSVGIDEQNSRVSITLDEMTDIRNVNIKSVSFNEESVKPSWDITTFQRSSSLPLRHIRTMYGRFEPNSPWKDTST